MVREVGGIEHWYGIDDGGEVEDGGRDGSVVVGGCGEHWCKLGCQVRFRVLSLAVMSDYGGSYLAMGKETQIYKPARANI